MMSYNIHPLLVHFPIAFLLLYSFLRILPFDRWMPQVPWRTVRQVLLLAGMLGGMLANATGETAEHLVRPNHKLVETHSLMAAASLWLYGLPFAGEVLSLVNPLIAKSFASNTVSRLLALIERILMNKALVWMLALLGAVAISLTGLLGGAMVYGATADPLAPFVLNLFGISL